MFNQALEDNQFNEQPKKMIPPTVVKSFVTFAE